MWYGLVIGYIVTTGVSLYCLWITDWPSVLEEVADRNRVEGMSVEGVHDGAFMEPLLVVASEDMQLSELAQLGEGEVLLPGDI